MRAPGLAALPPRLGVGAAPRLLGAPRAMAGRADGGVGAMSEWLARRGVRLEEYGKGDAKSLGDLAREVAIGESTLAWDETGNAVVRHVRVLSVRVISASGKRTLVETEQTLPDGRVRRRGNLPLSEKMKPGETVDEALKRAVSEELGSALERGSARIERIGEVASEETTRISPSYPCLVSRYSLTKVDCRVGALPQARGDGEAFKTVEPRGEAGVHTTSWAWIDL